MSSASTASIASSTRWTRGHELWCSSTSPPGCAHGTVWQPSLEPTVRTMSMCDSTVPYSLAEQRTNANTLLEAKLNRRWRRSRIISVTGRPKRSQRSTTFAELENLLAFIPSRGQGAKNTNTPGARASGVSISGIAGEDQPTILAIGRPRETPSRRMIREQCQNA